MAAYVLVDAAGQRICRGDTVALLNSSSDDNNHHHCALVVGMARPRKLVVRHVDGSKQATVIPGDVRVADRSFIRPSMFVASSTDPAGQLGIVTSVATELDLARLPPSPPTAAVVVAATAVSPAAVRPAVGEFSVGDYVVHSSTARCGWLGRVVEVCLDVDVAFGDGATCRVTNAGHATTLVTSRKTVVVDKNGRLGRGFFPGQRVDGGGGGSPETAIFRSAARWLKGYWKPDRGEGTVTRVETTSVVVDWLVSSSAAEEAVPPPANQQRPGDLCLGPSDVFDYDKHWAVGDRCFFRGDQQIATTGGARLTRREWRQQWMQRRPNRRRQRRSVDDDDDEDDDDEDDQTGGGSAAQLMRAQRRPLFAVARTRTTVDVLWQDGTLRRGVPSTSLVFWGAETEHDLFPRQHVVRRRTTPPPEGEEKEKEEECVGVVRGYDSKDKTVRVSWKKSDGVLEETLSAYDVRVVSCDWSTFCYGDIVYRPRQSASANDGDLSWVGQHVYCEGDEYDEQHVSVKWGDGNMSKVPIGEIGVVRQPGIDDVLHELGEWVDDDEAHEEDDEGSGEDDDDTDDDESDDGSGSESDSEDNDHASITRMNRIRVIVQAVIRLAGNIFAKGRRMYLKSGLIKEVDQASRTELIATESINNVTAEVGSNGGVGEGGGSTMDDKMEADAATSGDHKPFRFPQFEIVQQSPSDHHYIDNMKQGTSGGRKWTKRVQKEWKILENNNLPDTIYVQVFEDRMDLLRAVIIGATGTPYHDGLFFFDIQLPPSSYPAEPPLVNYRSFGLTVNPNLYPSGTVCLSLLNTFSGRDETELWSPEASTILQVVVSIQGLVLNAQPYYNEPDWAEAGTTMGQRNELPYSESTFLQSIQTMLHLLRRPPVGFEEFVRDHFRRRGQRVIRACEAYRDGCLVGTLDEEGNPTEGSRVRPCSVGFRIALGNVLPRLVEAFTSIDAT